LAIVFEGKFDSNQIGFSNIGPFEDFDEDVGAFGLNQCISGFFCNLSRDSGRARQANCKNSKNDCENSNYKGGDCGNFFTECMDELATVVQSDHQRSVRDGAVIVFGIIGLLCFAAFFDWLIARP